MDKKILDVRNLTKKFGKFTAVDDVSFSLNEGEILGFLGPNGAGKTTTMQLLLNLMEPTEGKINYFGKSLDEHREEILKQINFSSTYISFPWQFTVIEIMKVFSGLYEIDDPKRIDKLLKSFDLMDLLKKKYYMLSAGESTRLLLAKSFLNYPRIILLDEPTASLDPEIAVRIRNFLKKEREEYDVSILLTSHNMSEVEEMCDRIIVINHGKIIAQDKPENLAKTIKECTVELLIKNDHEKTTKLLKFINYKFTEEKFRFRIVIKENSIADLLNKLAEHRIQYEEISIDKPSLEDFFLEVIKNDKS